MTILADALAPTVTPIRAWPRTPEDHQAFVVEVLYPARIRRLVEAQYRDGIAAALESVGWRSFTEFKPVPFHIRNVGGRAYSVDIFTKAPVGADSEGVFIECKIAGAEGGIGQLLAYREAMRLYHRANVDLLLVAPKRLWSPVLHRTCWTLGIHRWEL